MLLLNTQLEDIPVMSLQSGSSLGTANEPIIDPRKLKIVAYYVTGPHIQETSVLHVSDIRELGPLGFIVNGSDSVMALDEDLVRLQEVVDFHFSLLGKTVVDEHKQRLGKVASYTIESDSFTVQKLHIAQSIMKNLSHANLIIHRSQIVELTDHVIVVRSTATPHSAGLLQALNPFRKNLATDSPNPTSIQQQK